METRGAINIALKIIGAAGFTGLVVLAPNAISGLHFLLRKSSIRKSGQDLILKELKRQNLVYITQDGENYHYTLTPKGAYRLQQVMIDELVVEVPINWDRVWRIVAFDVPVKFSKQRNQFVDKLKNLGFVMIQKSIWVHPASCFEQIEQLAGHYNVMRYCTLLEVNRIDDLTAHKLTRHFFPA